MSTTTTTSTPPSKKPTPAQLLEPLTADPSTTTTTTTTGAASPDDAVQAAVQGFTAHLRAAARTPTPTQPQTQTQDQDEPQTQPQETEAQNKQQQQQQNKESISHFVWTAYNNLLDAAERTPAARQGGLLEFVARLRGTVVKRDDGDGGEVLRYEGGELWRGMPALGWEVRERWNFDESDPKTTPEQRAEWENLNAFVAQLTARSADDADDALDFSMFGLWVMRDAFEAKNGVGSDTAVRVAALWVNYAGAYLRKLSADGFELSAKIGIPHGKYADRGWKGFNEDRWKAWGDELKVAQAKLTSDETVQGAAKVMEGL